jgi:hypothetical protein
MSFNPATSVKNRFAFGAAAAAALALFISLSNVAADNSKLAFDGRSLAGWHVLGPADWRPEKGEIVASMRQGGGWLVQDRSYQDLSVKFSFRSAGGGQTGILLGMEKAGENTTGIYVSLAEGDLSAYEITLDARGQEIERHKPGPARGGRSGNAAAAGGAAGRARRGQALAAPAGHPLSAGPPPPSLHAEGWNEVEVRLFTAVNASTGSLQVVLNNVIVNTGFSSGAASHGLGRADRIGAQPEVGRFGPLALRIAGNPAGEARFKDISIANSTEIIPTVERISNGFRMQRLTSFYYGDGTCIGDLNHDGIPDVVAGPMYWIGPDFKVGREIDLTQPLDITDYPRALGCEVADFTGDGWPDVVETGWPNGGPLYLYVNPHNELRRWPRYRAVNSVSEIYALADIDGDRKPAFVYGGDGYPVNYAKPDPADPTRPWVVHHIGEQANWGMHGLGVGDINGDGRLDVMRAWGWWEHPASETDPWRYHPAVLGRNGPAAGPGGAQMYVYDVNGDGLADIVTSLEGHGYGLAWFEQKRDKQGEITFEQHMIMDKDPAQSHGVVFTEMHGLALADVDSDGLKDIVTGKNKYNWGGHYEYTYPDEEGEGVVYWFKLVRKPGGQVDFIPHLIDNNSGIGRQPRVVDLNGDGVPDIVNGGRMGAFIFFGKKGAKDWTAVPR